MEIGNFHPMKFGRMLAKIGYSFAVAERGLGTFNPVARELILGSSDLLNHYVGGGMDGDPKPSTNLIELNQYTHNKFKYIVVTIRLFANLGAPTYHVFVGIDK